MGFPRISRRHLGAPPPWRGFDGKPGALVGQCISDPPPQPALASVCEVLRPGSVPGEAAAGRWREEAVMYGDTSAIRVHARRMRERGGDIRAEANALLRNAEAVPWTGLAAEAMLRLAREHAAELQACAAA